MGELWLFYKHVKLQTRFKAYVFADEPEKAAHYIRFKRGEKLAGRLAELKCGQNI